MIDLPWDSVEEKCLLDCACGSRSFVDDRKSSCGVLSSVAITLFEALHFLHNGSEGCRTAAMNHLAPTATVAVFIALFKLFLGRRRTRNSNDSNSITSQQSDSVSTSGDSDLRPLPIWEYEVFLSNFPRLRKLSIGDIGSNINVESASNRISYWNGLTILESWLNCKSPV